MSKLAADLATFYRRRIEPALQSATVQRMETAIDRLADPLFATQRESLVDRRKDADRPFMLFVVGVGKAGKSSLINAIVGADVAPKAIVPLTWKIDTYQRADEPCAILRWEDGRETIHELEQARALCAEEEGRARDADSRGQLYTGAIIEARWHLPEIELPPSVQLVDTPGLHQIRANLRDDPKAKRYRPLVGSSPDVLGLAQVYLNKADAVLWVLDGNALAGISGSAIDELKFYKRDQHAVINKIDTLAGVSTEEIEEHAKELFGDSFGRYFAVSAKRGRKSPEGWGMPALMRFIREEFTQHSARKKVVASETLIQVELEAAERIASAEAERLLGAVAEFEAASSNLAGRRDELLEAHSAAVKRDIKNAFASAARSITPTFAKQLTSAWLPDAFRQFMAKVPDNACRSIVEREVRAAADGLTADARVAYESLAIRRGDYDFSGRSSSARLSLHLSEPVPFEFAVGELSPRNVEQKLKGWQQDDSGMFSSLWESTKELFGASRWERRADSLKREFASVRREVEKRGGDALAASLEARLEQLRDSAEERLAEALGFNLTAAAQRAIYLEQTTAWFSGERRLPLSVLPIIHLVRGSND